METMMIKKRLSKAADRSFRLIAALLMRRAIARLTGIDDSSLSKAGLSRAAVADFLKSPLRTDPHRFFSRKHVQRDVQDVGTALESGQVSPPQPDPLHRAADSSIAIDGHCAQTNTLRRGTIMRAIRQMVSFRIRILTAGVVVAVCALSACSGSLPDRDAAQIRRDHPARCRLQPDAIPLAPTMRPNVRVVEASAMPRQPRARQPEARAGPPEGTG
jgi:hypothetical protein